MRGYSEFGLKARTVMMKQGMTITSLAVKLGISPVYLSEILRGTREGKKYKNTIAQILNLEGE